MSDTVESGSMIVSAGKKISEVSVSIGPKFLNLFSEHLYSSPNKAFEELVSNSWDADASVVEVCIPESLSEDSSIWVWDNGVSMDEAGLKGLWSVAASNKRKIRQSKNRKPIGKFGVGKLATYLLTHQLSYFCKASDGPVLAVTMDFRRVDNAENELHIEALPLDVRQISDEELDELIGVLPSAGRLKSLIEKETFSRKDSDFEDEYLGLDEELSESRNTWTLAVLSALKPSGLKVSAGWVGRILRTALPMGSGISIFMNGSKLTSAKDSIETISSWRLGEISDLDIEVDGKKVEVEQRRKPSPHLYVPNIGVITGQVRLYKDKLTGGRAEVVGRSNGFFVNVLGRVINPDDQYFGIGDLNHSVWPRFRATIRVDGLDANLSVNRETLAEDARLRTVRAILKKLFNIARKKWQDEINSGWPSSGEILSEKWGIVPFQPLFNVVRARAEDPNGSGGVLPSYIIPLTDASPAAAERWLLEIENSPKSIIENVVLEKHGSENGFVKYDMSGKRVVVNESHPFSVENSETDEQKKTLRNIAVVDLLTNAYMTEIGVSASHIQEILDYRDKALRLVAQVRRESAAQIAAMLNESTRHIKGFERIVGDAIEYLGFQVERLGQPGKPEGVAKAMIPPGQDAEIQNYKFTYDAKSTINDKVKTHNVGVSGLARHRTDFEADYSLVVAPDFEEGALEQECRQCGVTPIYARDLARLVMLHVSTGTVSLAQFRGIFELYSPKEVARKIDAFEQEAKMAPHLSLAVMLRAIDEILQDNPETPDSLTCSVIALKCRDLIGNKKSPTRDDVRTLLNGVSKMVPSLISVSGESVLLMTKVSKLKQAILHQLNQLPDSLKYDLDTSART
ncbi:ATP-binding protein [Burkholderia multivorans]|uniref:ATP-binding protein n=1 Tax=Burkholderia multivorans TaxID=87883 RepID=UPI000CFFE760|nr:ATP-binding protein [Burkholderia multivorans]PRE60106.1 hypothetical protein C6P82_23800 [Burkholderia multivorans]